VSASPIPIESPGINVAVVRKDTDGWKFLMLKRAETETYPGLWGFLTGGREGDETVPQLAIREMAEEISLRPESLWASEYCFEFYEPTVDKIWILPVLVAVVSADSAVSLSSENCEYSWATSKEASALAVWKNLKNAIAALASELEEFPAPNWVELSGW
jgi:8-oxo-dGTP pyrophosphatase MutT (NUDIX family)